MAGIGQWQPAQGAHAIQVAAATIVFAEGITEKLLGEAERAVSPIAKEMGLDQRTQLQGFALQIGPNGPQPTPEISGFDLSRLERPDFFSDKLSVQRNALRYEDWAYTRWAVLLEKINRLFSVAMPHYLGATVISSMSVEYVDVFLAPPASTDSVKLVIDEHSDFVARGAMSETELWHTHSGYFQYPESGIRRLRQVNVDVGESQAPLPFQRAVQIRTFAADGQDPGLAASSPSLSSDWTSIVNRLESLHNATKEDFRSVLTCDAATAVSLG